MENILVRSDEKREIGYLAVLSHLSVSYDRVFLRRIAQHKRIFGCPFMECHISASPGMSFCHSFNCFSMLKPVALVISTVKLSSQAKNRPHANVAISTA